MGQTTSTESRHGTELVRGAVYELHKPDPGERMQVEIVFMHGLQVKKADLKDAYFKTWRTADGQEVWPETWLKDEFPNARILSLAYDSSARESEVAGNMDPYLLGESLLDQMVSSAANIGQNDCPVVFVGHSLGGLIAKEIVVRCSFDRANSKYQNLLRNIKAVFFYATPHGGSYLADSWITKIAHGLGVKTSSLVEYLKPEGTGRTHIHDNFLRVVNKDCRFFVVAEGRETKFVKGNCIPSSAWIVKENSARLPGHDFVMLEDADHRTVCKPQRKNDACYLKLTDCIDRVIKEESRRLTVALSVDPIGIGGKIDKISELLERPEVSMVFLFGMGGAGKTTLSKEFYNRKAFKYVKSCFLDNVKSKKVEDVQKELLQELCGEQLDQHDPVKKQHLDLIKNCLLEQKVLVVIDDVTSSEEHLQALQVFHALETKSQSKVVVTGRDQGVVPQKYVNSSKAVIEPVDGIRDPKGSDMELFLRYAFEGVPQADKEKAETELLEEAKKIVRLCNGLPLSLEVIGKYLGTCAYQDPQQLKEIWTEASERLQRAQSIDGHKSDKLWSSLRISYDHLSDAEQKMFLDFACIFSELDVEKGLVERIWGSPIGVQNLVNKSLLKVQDEHFVMHDQLRDMGRFMLLEEALKECHHPIYLLEKDDCSKAFVEFKKCTTELGVPYITSVEQEAEKRLHPYSKLRLISVNGCNTPSLVDDCLPQCSRDLRWLRVRSCNGFTQIGMQKLSSFRGLRVLLLFDCDNIVELPEDIGKLTNLVEIEVWHCPNLLSLPTSIGSLKNLKRLVIASCSGLQVVPDNVGELSQVEYLSFEGCDQLTTIEGTQICTQNLKQLKLPIVPSACLHPCPKLQRLQIENGRAVTEFPQDFFKIDMPKLERFMWESSVPVVLKNPDGSELDLSEGFSVFGVKRHSDGSISRFHSWHQFSRDILLYATKMQSFILGIRSRK